MRLHVSFCGPAPLTTVDGRNPAPVDRYFIPLFTRFYTSQVVVWVFFHQQYPPKWDKSPIGCCPPLAIIIPEHEASFPTLQCICQPMEKLEARRILKQWLHAKALLFQSIILYSIHLGGKYSLCLDWFKVIFYFAPFPPLEN